MNKYDEQIDAWAETLEKRRLGLSQDTDLYKWKKEDADRRHARIIAFVKKDLETRPLEEVLVSILTDPDYKSKAAKV